MPGLRPGRNRSADWPFRVSSPVAVTQCAPRTPLEPCGYEVLGDPEAPKVELLDLPGLDGEEAPA